MTGKVFTDHTHIVAVKTTGNVYAWEAVEELNVKAKNWKDLMSEEPFTRKDIIHLQDPLNLAGRLIEAFDHVRKVGARGVIVEKGVRGGAKRGPVTAWTTAAFTAAAAAAAAFAAGAVFAAAAADRSAAGRQPALAPAAGTLQVSVQPLTLALTQPRPQDLHAEEAEEGEGAQVRNMTVRGGGRGCSCRVALLKGAACCLGLPASAVAADPH